ncbi:hypothetical protein Golob_015198 [Gossypium lobatum]|uniref:Uncharacterized protein n=1 Tax=Gossypium lobatum TaxID=34289 RepID=A0A7J8M0C4_9ROSI|nr:hypothetical protein [Gossypium lobatum]
MGIDELFGSLQTFKTNLDVTRKKKGKVDKIIALQVTGKADKIIALQVTALVSIDVVINYGTPKVKKKRIQCHNCQGFGDIQDGCVNTSKKKKSHSVLPGVMKTLQVI